MYSDHSGIKLEISNRMEFEKFTNTLGINTILNNQQFKEEITRKIRKYLDMNENNNTSELMGYSKSSVQNEIYSYKYLYFKKNDLKFVM